MFETTYTYRDIHMRCTLIIFKDKIDEIFSIKNDKSLLKTPKRNKKQPTIYKCYNPRPYQCGGFSPK